jgi:hypothetical protein
MQHVNPHSSFSFLIAYLRPSRNLPKRNVIEKANDVKLLRERESHSALTGAVRHARAGDSRHCDFRHARRVVKSKLTRTQSN